MKIPFFKIYWDEEDIESLSNVIRSGTNWATGENIELFEEKLAKYIGTKYAVVFNSGTSTLHSLMIAYGIGKGDEVIVPSFTYVATCNTPLFVGAKPVFADIEEETLGLDPTDVERKITSKTKAIIAVHYGGCPCKIRELKKIAEKHNLILIEDAAEAFGASIGKQKVGTFGDSASFSFCQNKIFTTGDGGCVTTNDKNIYEKLLLIRSHGKKDNRFVELGYNFRMSNLIAGLGISQLKKVDKIINLRRKNVDYISRRIGAEITSPKGYNNVYQMFSVRFSEEDRYKIFNNLIESGIEARIYFEPVHLTPFYKKLGYDVFLPITEEISNKIITLPMYPSMTREEMDYIVEQLCRKS
jgi:perosamine synthetase